MPSPEPERSETSLELTFPEHDADPGPAGTSLELPPSDPPPLPATTEAVATPEPATGPLGDLVVAHLRRVEVAMLGRVLVTTLGGALPPAMVHVERRRSFGGRLTGRAGEPVGVTITAGERTLSFRAPAVGVVEATIGHTVKGIVLSTTTVPVAQWLDVLSEVLDGLTRDDEATRTALERALVR